MKRTVAHVQKLLKPGGHLLIEIMDDARIYTSILGNLDGWWSGEEPSRADSPLLTGSRWDSLLKSTGFTGLDPFVWDLPNPAVQQGGTMVSTRLEDGPAAMKELLIVTSVVENQKQMTGRVQSALIQDGVGSLSRVVSLDTLASGHQEKPCVFLTELSSPLLKNPTSTRFAAIKNFLLERNVVLW